MSIGRVQRVTAVVLTLVCVLVAGALARAADAVDLAGDRVYHDAGRGQPVRFEFATLQVRSVRVGGLLITDDGPAVGAERVAIRTPGRYIAVELQIDAENERVGSLDVVLRAGKDRYRPLDSNSAAVAPMFSTTATWVFEVPTDAVDDLVLEVVDVEIIHSTQEGLRHRVEFSPTELAGAERVAVGLGRAETRPR